jgi:MFS family permease
MAGGAGGSNPIIDGIIKNDKTPWYKKKNLRNLYLWLVPFAMFIESTSGFDSSMMNGLQALSYWKEYFDNPEKAILGLLVSAYSLGAITSIPFVPLVSDWVGRRWSVVFGSVIMVIGSLLQGLSQNSKL